MQQDRLTGAVVQAMPLVEGKTNLIAGVHQVTSVIHCVTAGYIDVFFKSGATDSIDMEAGQDFAFHGSIDIANGKYHID